MPDMLGKTSRELYRSIKYCDRNWPAFWEYISCAIPQQRGIHIEKRETTYVIRFDDVVAYESYVRQACEHHCSNMLLTMWPQDKTISFRGIEIIVEVPVET